MIYIVMLNWNGLIDTEKCIESLLQSSCRSYGIILVDNGSENNEGNLLKKKFPNIELIINAENYGFAKGNNIGIKYALSKTDCKYIFLLNNDTTVSKDTLLNLHRFAKENPKTIVSPTILNYSGKVIQNMGGKIMRYLGGTYNCNKNRHFSSKLRGHSPDFLSGCAIFARKEIFEDIGGFYENYFSYCEDMEFSIVAIKKGYSIFVTTDAVIHHEHSNSLKNRKILKEYLILRNSIIFARRNLNIFQKPFFIAGSLLIRLLLAPNLTSFPLRIKTLTSALIHGFNESLIADLYKDNSR